MKRSSKGPILTAVLVDYDNIYLSLKRKSEEAAKRFAKDAGVWLKEIEMGRLISATNTPPIERQRRIVLNRCYGNPVPRRNTQDNSTDMSSFPFVRHHFLRAGFEVVDCPPLTAQLKNSSDIRMVMDVRDLIGHDTYFDEFIILSGDADFTPVLHRLRAHARHTVVYANDHTAAPYTAVSDGEVREIDLIALLAEGRLPGQAEPNNAPAVAANQAAQIEAARRDIIAEVVTAVRASSQPIPLEVLADRAVRALGHDKTAGSAWAGAGSFRELLASALPDAIRLSDQPPYFVIDTQRHLAPPAPVRAEAQVEQRTASATLPPPLQQQPAARAQAQMPLPSAAPAPIALQSAPLPQAAPAQPQPVPPQQRAIVPSLPPQAPAQTVAAQQQPALQPQFEPVARPAAAVAPAPAASGYRQAPAPQARRPGEGATALQQSIARIHDACQAPPLSPPEYRALFEAMAREINEQGLSGAQTLDNIMRRAAEVGANLRRDDIRFVLDVVSETDPWFEQGASPNLFAGRFRNFVVARCRSQGLSLSVDELDLIEAWFVGGGAPAGLRAGPVAAPAAEPQPRQQPQPAYGRAAPDPAGDRWSGTLDEARRAYAEQPAVTAPSGQQGMMSAPPMGGGGPQYTMAGPDHDAEDFPRIVRTRMRG